MEHSGCGDECRRTANFYEVLRSHEVLGLAGVERIPPSLRLRTQLYKNPLQYLTALSCRRLPTDSTQKTPSLQKPSFLNIVGRRNERAGMSAYGQVGNATDGQWAVTSPWILQGFEYLYGTGYFSLLQNCPDSFWGPPSAPFTGSRFLSTIHMAGT